AVLMHSITLQGKFQCPSFSYGNREDHVSDSTHSSDAPLLGAAWKSTSNPVTLMFVLFLPLQNKNHINKAVSLAGDVRAEQEPAEQPQGQHSEDIDIIAETIEKPNESIAKDIALRASRYYKCHSNRTI
uniref:Uncharacterized protein n=1 Tax=Oncorhynchus tshawytscha TaxID=74940 RepID=A0AAZ3R7E1_ONCTS